MASWDILCRVIDNFGDIGVAWRLARGLAERGNAVRLFVDDASALRWMAPAGAGGVRVNPARAPIEAPADVVVEAFGCGLDVERIQAIGRANLAGGRTVWINLEYLSAEAWVDRAHGLASPVHGAAAAGIHRWFFHPGFSQASGGLLREPGLAARQARFDRAAWLRAAGIDWRGEKLAMLFCYEPAALEAMLGLLARERTLLLVAPGRGADALDAVPGAAGGATAAGLRVHRLGWLSQDEFDHALWASDLNFVRGEDSLVRALWAGKALLWQAYPQADGVHAAKVEAFLDWMQAPDDLRRMHRAWNGIAAPGGSSSIPPIDWAGWGGAVRRARERALGGDDLVTRLERFVAGARGRIGPETR
jgi:uncharacterized repeat protein (TIGR03837 family)